MKAARSGRGGASRWQRLDPGCQALLVLAHLRRRRHPHPPRIGFDISCSSTAWRYVRDVVDLLAALADDLHAAGERAARLACAILDGTLVTIDRVADQKPCCSGKHRRHGVDIRVLADPAGRPVRASAALPGTVHDLTAARTHGLIDMPTAHEVTTFADKAHQGAGARCACRSSATHAPSPVTRSEGGQPGTRPAFAHSANAPSRCSRAGCAGRTTHAAHAEPPPSSRPSSTCTTSRPPPTTMKVH